jgi:hypothetical protein
MLSLSESLQHHGHTLWMDNYSNSPDLAHFPKTKVTNCVGTMCVNRKNVNSLVKG